MAIPVNDKLVTVESLKAGLDTKPNVSDVYAKSETYTKAEANSAIAQGMAVENIRNKFTPAGNWCEVRYALRTGHVVYLNLYVIKGTTGGADGKPLVTIDNSVTPAYGDYCFPCINEQAGTIFAGGSGWIEHGNVSQITYYGSELQAAIRINVMYFIAN